MKRIPATEAKNNFGGLLDDVAALGRVDVTKHGRVVAVVLSPQALSALCSGPGAPAARRWGETHMIPAELARAARIISPPPDFGDE